MGNLIHFLFFLVWNLIIKVLRVRICGSCWFLAIAFGVVRSGEVRICLQNQDQLAILANNTILVMYCISWFLPFLKGQKDFRQVFLRVETAQGLQSQEYGRVVSPGCGLFRCVWRFLLPSPRNTGWAFTTQPGPGSFLRQEMLWCFFLMMAMMETREIREVK